MVVVVVVVVVDGHLTTAPRILVLAAGVCMKAESAAPMVHSPLVPLGRLTLHRSH